MGEHGIATPLRRGFPFMTIVFRESRSVLWAVCATSQAQNQRVSARKAAR